MDYHLQRLQNGQHLKEEFYNGLIDDITGKTNFVSDRFYTYVPDYGDGINQTDFEINTKEKLHFATCERVNGENLMYSTERLMSGNVLEFGAKTKTILFMKKNGDVIDPSKIEIIYTSPYGGNIYFHYKKEEGETWNESEIIVHDFEYNYALLYHVRRNADGTIIRVVEHEASKGGL